MHPQRSVITRALGTDADVDVDVFTVEAEDGDLYLLCSDGLSTMVDTGTIEQILSEQPAQPRRGDPRADQGGERPRRRRQHHRDPVRGRRR